MSETPIKDLFPAALGRLCGLAGNPKTPKAIAEDLTAVLTITRGHEAEIARLQAQVERVTQLWHLETQRLASAESDAATARQERDALRVRCERLEAVAEECIDLLEEVQAQWGDSYLWTKWRLREQIAEQKKALEERA